MSKFILEVYTGGDEFKDFNWSNAVNLTDQNGDEIEVVFDSFKEAEAELKDILIDSREAYKLGYLSAPETEADFRIREVQ